MGEIEASGWKKKSIFAYARSVKVMMPCFTVVKITSRDIRGSRVKREELGELGRGVGLGVNVIAIKRVIGLGAVDVVMRTFSGRGREGDRRVGVDELVHKFEGREFQDRRR